MEKDSQLLKLNNYFDARMELLEKRIEDLTCKVKLVEMKEINLWNA